MSFLFVYLLSHLKAHCSIPFRARCGQLPCTVAGRRFWHCVRCVKSNRVKEHGEANRGAFQDGGSIPPISIVTNKDFPERMKQQTTQNTISFESLPLFLRIIAFLFGTMVLIANITGFHLNIISIFMLVLGTFCFLLSIYEDAWSFNMTTSEATRTFGFILTPFKKKISFDDIKAVTVFEFQRPITKASFTEVTVVFKNGKQTKLAYDKTNKIKDAIGKAEVLQTYFFNRNMAKMENLILTGGES